MESVMKIKILICAYCNKKFKRSLAEYKRSQKLKRPSYCCLSCSVSAGNKKTHRGPIKNLLRGRELDEYSCFRYAFKLIKLRHKTKKKYKGQKMLDLPYLKEIWEQQNGICPITGWNLILPDNSNGWQTSPKPERASLDRIDNNKGYVKGNVRFIAWMANSCRGIFPDLEVYRFAKAVSKKNAYPEDMG
jgi:hypothetical protein